MYLYLHGFNSSSQSNKAQIFRQWLQDQDRLQEWHCPDLPDCPSVAIKMLSELIEMTETKPKLVGSSLGGFYATVLAEKYALKAVIMNPAVYPSVLLRTELGIQKNWYSNETYEFTQQHLNELNELEMQTLQYPENIFLMQEKGDEVIDWKDAAAFYRDCHQLIFLDGDHGFSRFCDVLELIDRF